MHHKWVTSLIYVSVESCIPTEEFSDHSDCIYNSYYSFLIVMMATKVLRFIFLYLYSSGLWNNGKFDSWNTGRDPGTGV